MTAQPPNDPASTFMRLAIDRDGLCVEITCSVSAPALPRVAPDDAAPATAGHIPAHQRAHLPVLLNRALIGPLLQAHDSVVLALTEQALAYLRGKKGSSELMVEPKP